MLDTDKIRKDFPLVEDYIYFDNACLTLKPIQVIDKVREYYEEVPVCSDRSSHSLANRLTKQIRKGRESVSKLINSESPFQIVYTKNATESINLVAKGLGLDKGDVVISTDKEHNSNLVPWILLQKKEGVKYKQVPSLEDGSFDMDSFEEIIDKDVELVTMVHTSNLDGYTIPAKEIGKIVHDHDALFMLDGAQSVPHCPIDVQDLDVDLLAFSLHKMLGPTGVGVLYGKSEILEELEPLVAGGGSIKSSSYDDVVLHNTPTKFEGGLQNYASLYAVEAAVDYLQSLGLKKVHEHEKDLNKLAFEELPSGVDILGPEDPERRTGILNFTVPSLGCHEVSLLLEEMNILTRGGMQCVHSWYTAKGLEGGTRASFYVYNTKEEVIEFVEAIERFLI